MKINKGFDIPSDNDCFIGIDPDTRNVTAAIMLHRRVHVLMYKVPSSVKSQADCLSDLALSLSKIRLNVNLPQGTKAHLFTEMQSAAYTAKKGANPNDLLFLANAGGIVTAWIARELNIDSSTFVMASEWKGSLPKRVNQYRTLQDLGLTKFEEKGGKEPYIVPLDYDHVISVEILGKGKLNDSDWTDILDSIGLALYGSTKGIFKLKAKGKA